MTATQAVAKQDFSWKSPNGNVVTLMQGQSVTVLETLAGEEEVLVCTWTDQPLPCTLPARLLLSSPPLTSEHENSPVVDNVLRESPPSATEESLLGEKIEEKVEANEEEEEEGKVMQNAPPHFDTPTNPGVIADGGDASLSSSVIKVSRDEKQRAEAAEAAILLRRRLEAAHRDRQMALAQLEAFECTNASPFSRLYKQGNKSPQLGHVPSVPPYHSASMEKVGSRSIQQRRKQRASKSATSNGKGKGNAKGNGASLSLMENDNGKQTTKATATATETQAEGEEEMDEHNAAGEPLSFVSRATLSNLLAENVQLRQVVKQMMGAVEECKRDRLQWNRERLHLAGCQGQMQLKLEAMMQEKEACEHDFATAVEKQDQIHQALRTLRQRHHEGLVQQVAIAQRQNTQGGRLLMKEEVEATWFKERQLMQAEMEGLKAALAEERLRLVRQRQMTPSLSLSSSSAAAAAAASKESKGWESEKLAMQARLQAALVQCKRLEEQQANTVQLLQQEQQVVRQRNRALLQCAHVLWPDEGWHPVRQGRGVTPSKMYDRQVEAESIELVMAKLAS
jgi:hypothetical protein